MKKEKRKIEQWRNRSFRAFTAVALLGVVGMAYGQGEPLSQLNPVPVRSPSTEVPPVAMDPVPYTAPVRITDDGRQGDQRGSTNQLILAFASDRAHAITVEVFDEQGRRVQRSVLRSKPGKSALAMNVAALREGRYVAQITEGAGGRTVRFQR